MLLRCTRIHFSTPKKTGSISTADGSALVRLGNTTVVCGVKAEIAEPELDAGLQGFLGAFLRFFSSCPSDPTYGQCQTSIYQQCVPRGSSLVHQVKKPRCSRIDLTTRWLREFFLVSLRVVLAVHSFFLFFFSFDFISPLLAVVILLHFISAARCFPLCLLETLIHFNQIFVHIGTRYRISSPIVFISAPSFAVYLITLDLMIIFSPFAFTSSSPQIISSLDPFLLNPTLLHPKIQTFHT